VAWMPVCPLDDLGDPDSRGVELETPDGEAAVFVVRRDGHVLAYRNRCPHTGAPLDWMPGRFLDPEGEMIVCATHGALFRIDDGYCVFGPCRGQSLTPVPSLCEAGTVYVMTAPGTD